MRHCPNQTEHNATLPYIILIGIQKTSAEARILRRMPFLTQSSPFPGLGLASPMAPIMVEAGDYAEKTHSMKKILSPITFLNILASKDTKPLCQTR
jgi:hypothetical protein